MFAHLTSRLSVFVALAVPVLAQAQESTLPVIVTAMPSSDHTQITISGVGFGSGTPKVSLSGTNPRYRLAVSFTSPLQYRTGLKARTP